MENRAVGGCGVTRSMRGRSRWIHAALVAAAFLWHGMLTAATYTNSSIPFAWIDPSTHSKVGYLTTPYKLNKSAGCATTLPVLDDALSDLIPIGFNFLFGATTFTSLYIQTNGRIQFGNVTCGAGTQSVGPPQRYPYLYPISSMNSTMKVFGVDLDPTNLVDKPNYPSAARKTTCTSNLSSDANGCYISWAMLGSAPNRQFVITWKNVPEWVSSSTTSGSFDLQVILNENGTFIYQYGSIAHGGTGSAQIGWQLTTSDYDVLTFGASSEPPPDTAILFYNASATPIAEYRFEQGAWSSGVAGQVADAALGARHGTALGAAQTTNSGYVCRGASIPLNSTAAAVDAIRTGVRFSDAGVNMQGQGTAMFWYRSNVAWNSGQEAQLLDATLVNGQWFSLSRTTTGSLFFQVTDSINVVRSVETPAQVFAAGAWVHVTVSWNFNALAAANSDRIRIMINGGTPTASAFTTTGSLHGSLDYLHAGDNPSGFTSAKTTVNSANGTIDSLRAYNVELLQGQVLLEMAESHVCNSFVIDHLELRHTSWSGIACAPSTLTIAACADASCSSPYTSGLVATLSSTGAAVLWDPSMGGATVVIGAGQSSTTRSFYSEAGVATLNVIGTGNPAMERFAKKCDGVAASCNWTSANGGLVMTLPGAGLITGAKPVAVSVQAVQSSGPTPGAACVPVQNLANAGLKVWSTAVNPGSFAATGTSAGDHCLVERRRWPAPPAAAMWPRRWPCPAPTT